MEQQCFSSLKNQKKEQQKIDKYNQSNTVNFETESIKLSLGHYSDAYILVTGDTTIIAGSDTHVAFKNCAPFLHVGQKLMFLLMEQIIYIAMPMHNFIEYSDNYSHPSGSI